MAVGQHFDPRAGREAQESIEVVARELGETKGVVADMLKAWADFSKSGADARAEIQARLGAIEQVVAMRESLGSGAHSSGGPSVGAQALQALGEDGQFTTAAEAAQRGMKPSSFAARVNVDGSIHAALTNEHGITTSEGGMPSQPGRGGIVGAVQRPLRLLDVLPRRAVANDAIEFVQLHATGDAAEQELEGDAKAEVSLDGVLVRVEIATIAGWTAASKQVLADHNALQQQIDRTVRNKVLDRLEHQLINGGGSTGKIRGLVDQATPFVPAIGSTAADVIGEALMAHARDGYRASVVILHPSDWYRLQIEKTATEQAYLFGSPTAPLPPALWNASVVTTPSIDQGTALTLDPSFVTILDRELLSVQVSNQHADFFTRNLVAILAELRAGLEVADQRAIFSFDLPAVSE
ncbi:MAG TPA: phage major capsid protein [Zeimonas sp.]